MLEVVQNNRLERLAGALIERLRAAPPAPFAREPVIVPSAAVGRWLTLAIARSPLRIAAGIDVPFAAAYIWRLFAQVLPDLPERSPFDPRVMEWRLARLLATVGEEPAFTPVRRYLARGAIADRLELARALATVFDSYAAYRPAWLESWLRGETRGLGEHEAWQAALWRQLAAPAEPPAAAARVRGRARALPQTHPKEAFFRALEGDLFARNALPPRVSLFAVDALAPLYLEIVERLAAYVPVTLYVMNPCRQYWGLIESEAAVARAALVDPQNAGYLEVGNPLLAALGRHARDFIDALGVPHEPEGFVEPPTATLLGMLQGGVLDLQDPQGAGRRPIAASDRSVEIHVCHGPIREAEVLHDQLLWRLAADPTLEPEDVLVLTPDPQTYAAAIEAVFGSAPASRLIPFTIADGAVGRMDRLAASLLAIARTALGRFHAEAVVRLLEEPAVAGRFAIAEDDLPRIRRWVAETGIRWGLDEQTAHALDLPAARGHTWAAGLDRLVFGAAVAPAAAGAAELPVVPYDDIEGGATALAGALVAFIEALAGLAGEFARRRSVPAWCATLLAALDDFHRLAPADIEHAAALRATLEAIAEDATLAGFDEAVPAEIVLDRLERTLAGRDRAAGFMRGGVTVAALRAGGVVPARIVCLVGLNDNGFPAREPARGFDLIAIGRRERGDRRRRDEDRHAFLAALLGARDAVLITYTGRGARDDQSMPPSVVVDELRRAVTRGFTHPAGDAAAAITVAHPLNAFSVRYYSAGRDAERLHTYAAEWRPGDAARAPPAPIVRDALLAASAPGELSLDALEAFFRNPARAFLRDRLGLRLAGEDAPIEASEMFLPDGLANFQLTERVIAALEAGVPVSTLRRRLQADGLLPTGASGQAVFAGALEIGEQVVGAARAALGHDARVRTPLAIELDLGTVRVSGVLDGLYPAGQRVMRGGRLRAADRLAAWIRHLALVVAAPADVAPLTWMFGRSEKGIDCICLAGLAGPAARAILGDLVTLWGAGQRAYLPLYPKTGLAYVQALRKRRADPDVAMRNSWHGTERMPAEKDDRYVALAVRDDPEPLGPAFIALARQVFDPMLDHEDAAASRIADDAEEPAP